MDSDQNQICELKPNWMILLEEREKSWMGGGERQRCREEGERRGPGRLEPRRGNCRKGNTNFHISVNTMWEGLGAAGQGRWPHQH